MSHRNLDFLELNQKNVLALYEKCLIPKEDIGKNPDNEIRTKIFTVESCGKDSPEVVFSAEKIDIEGNNIEYLLGQLKVAHDGLSGFTLPMGFINYKNQPWTKDNTTLIALYYLGVGSRILPIFRKIKGTNQIASTTNDVIPSYSQNDPNFFLLEKSIHEMEAEGLL